MMQHESLAHSVQRWLFVLGILASAVFLFYAFENWRGRRAWQQFSTDMTNRGEHLDWEHFRPKPVPDDENFMTCGVMAAIAYRGDTDPRVLGKLEEHPLNKYSFDSSVWRAGVRLDLEACGNFLRDLPSEQVAAPENQPAAQQILNSLAPLDAEFAELRAASLRPFSQLRSDKDPGMSVPHFVALRMLSYLLALRTSAELALARTDDAFADAWVLQRIAAALVQAPHLVGTMVGAAIQGGMGLQTFWEGLSRQSWSEDQLRRFQRSFTEIDLLQGLDHALRAGERAGVNHFVRQHSTMELAELFGAGPPSPGTGPWLKDLYRKAWPRGWIYQNQVVHNRLLEETAFGNYDLGKRRVYPDKCRQSAEAMNQRINAWNPFVYLAAVGIPNTPRATETVARIQTYMSEAAVACALELFRRRGGEYPPALAALAPEFIAALPHDLVTGGPLMYRRSSPVRYTLYAVGWDGKDDGGAPENAAASNNPATAMKGGDWPWPEPVTPASQ